MFPAGTLFTLSICDYAIWRINKLRRKFTTGKGAVNTTNLAHSSPHSFRAFIQDIMWRVIGKQLQHQRRLSRGTKSGFSSCSRQLAQISGDSGTGGSRTTVVKPKRELEKYDTVRGNAGLFEQ
jgi:hypothetical protein